MGLLLALIIATAIFGLLTLAAGYAANWNNRRRPFLWGFFWGLVTALGPILTCARARGLPGWTGGMMPEWLPPVAFLAGALGFPLLFAWGQPRAFRRWLYAQLILVPSLVPAAGLGVIAALCSFT